MSKTVDGVPLQKWVNLEVYEFETMVIRLSKFQKNSLAKSLRVLYEVIKID